MRHRHDTYRTFLRGVPLLDGCDAGMLELVARGAEVVDLPEGIVVAAPGAGRGELLVVLTGTVRAGTTVLAPGDCHVAAPTAARTLITASSCRLLVVGRRLLVTLLDRDPRLAARVAAALPAPQPSAPVVPSLAPSGQIASSS
jgi:hypothetical protein